MENNTFFFENIYFANGDNINLMDVINLEGTDDSETLYGMDRDDRLFGYDGNDSIYAQEGNDILTGGVGQDTLYGGDDDDTYVFNLGDADNSGNPDYLYENADEGTDTILFGKGIAAEDVRLWADVGGTLIVKFSTDDLISVGAGTTLNGETTIGDYLESIAFDDETVWDLTGGLYLRADDA